MRIKTSKVIPIILSSILAILLTFWLSSDVNSDLIVSTLCGETDIEFSDFYNRVLYNKSVKNIDQNIVIVNIDSIENRIELTQMIDNLERYNPLFVGVDVLFEEYKDSVEDTELINSILRYDNIVLAEELSPEEKTIKTSIWGDFIDRSHFGIVNMVTRNSHRIRTYMPFFELNSQRIPSFCTQICRHVSKDKYMILEDRKNDEEVIIYSPTFFYEIDGRYLDKDSIKLNGSIVLVGSLSDFYDKHFTPVNDNMPGILILAHILSGMLNEQYLKPVGIIFDWIIAVCVCVLLCVLYVSLKDTDYQSLCIRLVPMLIILFLGFLGAFLYSHQIYLNISKTILTSALGIFILDIIYAFSDIFKFLKTKK